ncbi:hypothetical protein [Sporofaciens musculi]|uniref:hypothetical protein n=1 Tax=Sporofaciens musculi TaxID=2681861 RepID=UPI002570AB14|nr:hypothetical protein [Sporofaciens musculi]
MVRKLDDYLVNLKDDIFFAHWKLHKNGAILLVLDENGDFQGVATFRELRHTYVDRTLRKVEDIYNANCKYIVHENEELDFLKARSLFLDFPNIFHIPIIDREKHVWDIISRERAFWKIYYVQARLPRMHYAYCIYNAAQEAKALGYDKFSVLEFGVAGGNGLVNCEFHAREIERLFNIGIEIYGFDSGEGLPEKNMGYKDMVNLWPGGSYKMDKKKLEERLRRAKLVLGSFQDTTEDFLDKYCPAPIGCVLVDVDYYSSTLPILSFLKNQDSAFMPRIYMYWDDIIVGYEFQGESLAIKEFNESNSQIKISPESLYYQDYRARIKICHRFSHMDYNRKASVFDGRTMDVSEYELPLEPNVN